MQEVFLDRILALWHTNKKRKLLEYFDWHVMCGGSNLVPRAFPSLGEGKTLETKLWSEGGGRGDVGAVLGALAIRQSVQEGMGWSLIHCCLAI